MNAGPQDLAPGTTLGGRYQLVRAIGRGSMGAVYEAVQMGIGRHVALKTVSAGMAQNTRRLAREAEAVGSLNHPNIVQVSDVHIDPHGTSYMVMELLNGDSLDALVSREAFDPERIVRIARQVLDALDCAHASNIIHRDLKPANLFITKTHALGEVVKVLDFGVAKLEDRRTQLTEAGNIVGTPMYMAPEQVRGDPVGPGTDLWSLGIVLYELLGGRSPFAADTWQDLLRSIMHDPVPPLERVRPGLPAPLYAAVRGALEKDPKKRFRAAAEMDQVLASAQTQLGIQGEAPLVVRRTAVQGGTKATERIGSLDEVLADSRAQPVQVVIKSADPRPEGSPLDLRNQLSTGEKVVLQQRPAETPPDNFATIEDPTQQTYSLPSALPPPPKWLFVVLGLGAVVVVVGLALLFLLG